MNAGTAPNAPIPSPTTPRAGRREWVGLAVIALPCLLYSMDLTVLHLAVPKLSEDLQPSSSELLWIIDIYGFLVAGSLITMGTIGDRIGRRRLLMIGAGAFGLASLLAAFSTSAEMLIVSRAILGLAGATLAPSTLSLIRNMFLDAQQRTTAIAVWITAYSVGGAIGPILGGVMLEFFWWGSVFLLAVPVMVLLLAVAPVLLPEYRDPNAGRPDVLSAVLSLGAVLTVIYGIKQIAQDGIEALSLASILIGLGLAVVFVRRQRTLADPLIDLSLFRVPAFSASLATYGLAILVMFGGFLFIPQYLQLVRGLSPIEAGLWTLPWAGAFIVGSMVTPLAVRVARPAYVMAFGLLLGAVGFALFTQLEDGTAFVPFALTTVAFAIGLAPVFTLTTDLVVGAAPPERAGAASAISETSAEFGGALGIAIFGSIGVAVYRGQMDSAITGNVPPAAADSARDTLAGALSTAEQLPADVGAALVNAATRAFVDGLQLTALISAVLAVAMAVAVAVMLRDVEGTHITGPADEAPLLEAREPVAASRDEV